MSDTKERINKMLKKSEAILQAGKPKQPLWGDEHDPCEHCSVNPKNGGSGLCNCTLACQKIT